MPRCCWRNSAENWTSRKGLPSGGPAREISKRSQRSIWRAAGCAARREAKGARAPTAGILAGRHESRGKNLFPQRSIFRVPDHTHDFGPGPHFLAFLRAVALADGILPGEILFRHSLVDDGNLGRFGRVVGIEIASGNQAHTERFEVAIGY